MQILKGRDIQTVHLLHSFIFRSLRRAQEVNWMVHGVLSWTQCGRGTTVVYIVYLWFLGTMGWPTESCRRNIARWVYKLTKSLLLGKKSIEILGRMYSYIGDLDPMGKTFGYGKATREDSRSTIEGTFMNEAPHGFCK